MARLLRTISATELPPAICEHETPRRPTSQRHFPRTQMPRPLQSSGQSYTDRLQSRPIHPWWQMHLMPTSVAEHTPWLEQSFMQSTVATAMAMPPTRSVG